MSRSDAARQRVDDQSRANYARADDAKAELDASKCECESCGESGVYAAEELLLSI
jgi:hypothetical protein